MSQPESIGVSRDEFDAMMAAAYGLRAQAQRVCELLALRRFSDVPDAYKAVLVANQMLMDAYQDPFNRAVREAKSSPTEVRLASGPPLHKRKHKARRGPGGAT